MEEYLQSIVAPLVENPSSVRVERQQDERGILLILHVDQSDLGKVIGRNGDTAKAIRHLIRCKGAMNKAYVSMKIHEPNRVRQPVPTTRPDYRHQQDDLEL